MANPVFRVERDGKLTPTGSTIATRWVDSNAAEEVEVDPRGIAASTRREISPDGNLLMLTLPDIPFLYVHMHADDPLPDIVVFRKQN
jgi:hypothetical protein